MSDLVHRRPRGGCFGVSPRRAPGRPSPESRRSIPARSYRTRVGDGTSSSFFAASTSLLDDPGTLQTSSFCIIAYVKPDPAITGVQARHSIPPTTCATASHPGRESVRIVSSDKAAARPAGLRVEVSDGGRRDVDGRRPPSYGRRPHDTGQLGRRCARPNVYPRIPLSSGATFATGWVYRGGRRAMSNGIRGSRLKRAIAGRLNVHVGHVPKLELCKKVPSRRLMGQGLPLAVGIDVISVAEVAVALARFGDRYVRRAFTAREATYCRAAAGAAAAARFAARFAAKEATVKALQPHRRWADWTAIEVRRCRSGRCVLVLHRQAASLATRRGIEHLELSMSHDGDQAVAIVAALRQPRRTRRMRSDD